MAERHGGSKMKRRVFLALVLASVVGVIVPSMARAYDGEFFRVCRLNPRGDNYLSLRRCPSTRCREIFRMGPGTWVRSIYPKPRRGWWEIEIMPGQRGAGLSGWAFGRYLCPAPPPPGW